MKRISGNADDIKDKKDRVKKDVVAFLDELHRLLSSDEFDMDIDLELVQRKKNGTDQKFSTPYTL